MKFEDRLGDSRASSKSSKRPRFPRGSTVALREGIGLVRQLTAELDGVERKIEVSREARRVSRSFGRWRNRSVRTDEYLTRRAKRSVSLSPRSLRASLACRASAAEAIEYSLVSPRKRIRPILVLAAGEALGAEHDRYFNVRVCVEMVHTYSLVHDDFRRWMTTICVAVDDGITRCSASGAILAVTALDRSFRPDERGKAIRVARERRLAAVRDLAACGGRRGHGRRTEADILAEVRPPTFESSSRYIVGRPVPCRGSVRIGSILAGADPLRLDRLIVTASDRTRFQIADDLLDELGDSGATGNRPAAIVSEEIDGPRDGSASRVHGRYARASRASARNHWSSSARTRAAEKWRRISAGALKSIAECRERSAATCSSSPRLAKSREEGSA